MKNKLVHIGVVFLLVLSLMPNALLANEKVTTNVSTTPETTNKVCVFLIKQIGIM